MKEIAPRQLAEKRSAGEHISVIDVREPYEREIVSIEAKKIPMDKVMDNIAEIPTDCDVVFFCKSGNRAAALVDFLETHHSFNNLYNLKGGILGYIEEVEPQLPTY